jgi:PhnB protein
MTESQSTVDPRQVALAPHLICADAAAAIEFYKQAFGAEELMRLPDPDPNGEGKLMHACVAINGAAVMLMDESEVWGTKGPKQLGGSPVTLNLGVDDADAWAERAVAAGAELVMPVQEQFWGDRYGVVVDPFGHSWALITPVREMSVEEINEAAGLAPAG